MTLEQQFYKLYQQIATRENFVPPTHNNRMDNWASDKFEHDDMYVRVMDAGYSKVIGKKGIWSVAVQHTDSSSSFDFTGITEAEFMKL